MKSKTWTVTVRCWQGEASTPEDHHAVYRVQAQRAGTAFSRALLAWQRETGKRIGRETGIYMQAVTA